MKRAGFSLIELVLSIVIIAIAVMSIPMMLQESAKNDRYSLLQESILASRTKMGNILSFKWDNNSEDGGGSSSTLRVLDVNVTNGSDSELARVSNGNRRIGHVFADKRRRFKDLTSSTRASNPTVNTIIDDIDDFDGNVSTVYMQVGAVGNSFDYLDQSLQMTVAVRFIDDNTNYSLQTINFVFDPTTRKSLNIANSTNIKMIELSVTTGINADTPFVFRAFSSNIGQSNLETKEL